MLRCTWWQCVKEKNPKEEEAVNDENNRIENLRV